MTSNAYSVAGYSKKRPATKGPQSHRLWPLLLPPTCGGGRYDATPTRRTGKRATVTDIGWPYAAPALVYFGTDDMQYRIDVGSGVSGLPDREQAIARALIQHAVKTQEEV